MTVVTERAQTRTKPAIRIFHTWVSDVETLNAHMMRITLEGGDLSTYESAGPDCFIYTFFPRAETPDKHAIEHDFTWEYWRTLPVDEQQVGRYYTVRSFDPGRAAMQIDVVVHGNGPGSTWASTRAARGDAVAFWGPRTAYAPPDGTTQWLLVGDETGLPAIGAILEDLPAGAHAEVVIELPDAEMKLPLSSTATFNVRWVLRDGAEAGMTTSLLDAVREMELADGVYAWGGAEFEAMKTIKAYLSDERGLTSAQLSMVGYWRHPSHTGDE